MGNIIQLTANFKIENSCLKKFRDLSQGTQHKLIATRLILGKKVEFYRDGTRKVIGISLSEQEKHSSEVLRFAHVSILTQTPQGDKSVLYVDASVDPVEIWVSGVTAERYLAVSKNVIDNGILDAEFLLEETKKELKNV